MIPIKVFFFGEGTESIGVAGISIAIGDDSSFVRGGSGSGSGNSKFSSIVS